MHSNPTATRSLCCRSRRVEWLPPLHSASLYTFIFFSSLSLSLSPSFSFSFPFVPGRTRDTVLRGPSMGALSSEKDERIAFHCTQLRVAHVRAVVKVDPQGTQVALQRETRTRRSASTRRTQEVLFIPGYTTRWFHGEVGNGRLSRFYRERTNSPPDATLIIRSFV